MAGVAGWIQERMADPEAPMGQGIAMAAEALDLLREVRDNTRPGDSPPRSLGLRRPIGIDVAAGGGQASVNVPAGTSWRLDSYAIQSSGTGGRLTIYVGGVAPENILDVLDLPGAAIAGSVRAAESIEGGEYVPPNTNLFFVLEGIATDGRAVVNIRGKVTVDGDPMPTNQGSS